MNENYDYKEQLSGRLKEFDRQLTSLKAKPGAADALHRTRVSARRLRDLLWIFKKYLGKSSVKKWNRSIKKLSKRLNKARELDVQLEFLDGLSNQPDYSGSRYDLEKLILIARNRRRELKTELLSALNGLEKDQTMKRLERLFKALPPLAVETVKKNLREEDQKEI